MSQSRKISSQSMDVWLRSSDVFRLLRMVLTILEAPQAANMSIHWRQSPGSRLCQTLVAELLLQFCVNSITLVLEALSPLLWDAMLFLVSVCELRKKV